MSDGSRKVAALALVFASAATVARFAADEDRAPSRGVVFAVSSTPVGPAAPAPQTTAAAELRPLEDAPQAASVASAEAPNARGAREEVAASRSTASPREERPARLEARSDRETSDEAAPPAPHVESERTLTCSFEDPGAGVFKSGHLGTAEGHLHVPPAVADGFTLLLHFHNGDVVRRLLAASDPGVVLATIDAGVGSKKYAKAVDPMLPRRVLDNVARKTGHTVGKVVLSSWSAGYGAIREWLHHAPDTVAAVILLDSVHTSYGPSGALDRGGIGPFVELAKRAKEGSPFVWLTHSSIVPPGFASTTEVADAILGEVGGKRRFGGMDATYGVELKTRYDEGALHVRGFTGVDKGAHCAHLRMLPDILERELLPYLGK